LNTWNKFQAKPVLKKIAVVFDILGGGVVDHEGAA
jgi:hypothetical protein